MPPPLPRRPRFPLPALLVYALGAACTPPADTAETGTRADTAPPAGLDSDGDGIDDAQERAEGTDPHDPASAGAWHPEFTARPRLLTDETGLEALRDALEQEGEPWESLASRIQSRCDAEPSDPEETMACSTANGNIALACAVRYAAGDEEAGQKAVEVLEAMSTEVEITGSTAYTVDLRAGQGLLQGIRAWDLLQGAGYPEGEDPEVARAVLHDLGAFLWDFYVEDYPYYLRFSQNNHNTKFAASLGALGMGANDDERSARYVNYAAVEIPRIHDRVLCDDGGYAESPSYQVYAMESELPWMIALHRWLGEDELEARRVCTHDDDPDCVEEPVTVTSPLLDDRVCDGFDRYTELLMPAGYSPNTDDGNLGTGHLGLVAGVCQTPNPAWGWTWQAVSYDSQGSVDVTADTLLAWSDAPEGEAPATGPLLREDSGWAVLRTDWDREAAYALLAGENGVARTGGRGHEHPDALAFLWATRGEYLLIDSGYGNYDDHGEVIDAEAHNVILVDGEGSGGTDAWVDEVRQQGDFQVASGHAAYEGVEWERTLVMVGDEALVTWDHTTPTDGATHTLTHLVQGATDTLTLTETEGGPTAQWTVGDQTVHVAVIADHTTTTTTATQEHAFSYSDYQEHGVLETTVEADEDVTWLMVAVVGDEPTLAPGADRIVWEGGEAGLQGDLVWGGVALE